MWRTAAWALVLAVVSSAPTVSRGADLPPLVFEGGRRSQYEAKDGVLRLRGGPGWLRSRHVFSNFVLTAEFRIVDVRTEAAVGIRTLTLPERWPQTGYQVTLSGKDDPGQVIGRGAPVRVLRAESVPPPTITGEWRTLVVAAEGNRITTSIDGTLTSVAEITHLTGSVLFEVRRGTAEFRTVNIRPLLTCACTG